MLKGLEIKVSVTDRSFTDAGGSQEFPDLELRGLVLEQVFGTEGLTATQEKAINDLKNKAKKRGCTHIFDLKLTSEPAYILLYDPFCYWCTARGIGYRPKSD